jgi:hypothetical protein
MNFGSCQNYISSHPYDQISNFNSLSIHGNRVIIQLSLQGLHNWHFLNIPEAEGMFDADGVRAGSGVWSDESAGELAGELTGGVAEAVGAVAAVLPGKVKSVWI